MRSSLPVVALSCVVSGWLTLADAVAQQPEASVSQAIAALGSSDQPARLRAIDQLGDLGAKATPAVTRLAGLLQDASPMVRARAARSLGKIGAAAKPAAPALVALAKDPDEKVRRQAVKALGHIRPGREVVGPLFQELLEDADPGVRSRALHALAEIGAEAVPGLVEALQDEEQAYWACLVLREIGPAAKQAVPALAAKLKDPRPEVRREAILALAAMDEAAAPAVPQIAGQLGDQATRVAATYALGRIGGIPADAQAKIRQATKGADKLLSTTSLWALARVHPEDKQLQQEATEQLVERIKDKDANVRAAAGRALAALPGAVGIVGPVLEKSLENADSLTIQHALDALAAFGAKAVPGLTNALKHKQVRAQAANVLGQIGPAASPATSALAQLVDDKDVRVANEAALALAKIGPAASAAVPALAKAVGRPENPASHASAYALGRIGRKAAAAEQELLKAVAGKDQLLALLSAWALTQIQPGSAEMAAKVVPVLIDGLTSPLPRSREAAADALSSLGALAKDSASALEKASKDEDPQVRQAAARALDAIRAAAPKAKDAAAALRRGSVVVTVVDGVVLKAGSEIVARLPKGTSLKVLERHDPWLGVQLELDGQLKTGWVLPAEVAPAKDSR